MSKEDTGNPQEPAKGQDKDLENKADTPAPDTGNAAEAEELRKQLQKLEMEKNLLRNKLDEKTQAEKEKEQKELEEKEEYRTLYQQTKSRLEEIEAEKEKTEQQKQLEKARNEILSEYSDDVQETAKELGLDLTVNSDEERESFKKRVDAIANRIGANKVNPNNPGQQRPASHTEQLENYVKHPNDQNFQSVLDSHPAFKKAKVSLGYDQEN